MVKFIENIAYEILDSGLKYLMSTRILFLISPDPR